MRYPFWVVLGHENYPAETTCSMKDEATALETVAAFKDPSRMLPTGLSPAVLVFKPGEEVPDHIAQHVVYPR
jgi:hypothetical protein